MASKPQPASLENEILSSEDWVSQARRLHQFQEEREYEKLGFKTYRNWLVGTFPKGYRRFYYLPKIIGVLGDLPDEALRTIGKFKCKEITRFPEGAKEHRSLLLQNAQVMNCKSFTAFLEKRFAGTKYDVELGEPIDFRGLRHAPLNEQGVVYLFGMVSWDLDIHVESIRTKYPDCEAIQKVKGKREWWKRIRIEFEHKSSNFNHDVSGCDLIVCWEHDWSECPLPVIELRSVIKNLPTE